jgi:hypothetical protein
MGRVSRDARLLFILLWTIADDSGITRAASRMLASLLFPYDDDASGLMDGWLKELSDEGCIDIYEVDGSHYLKIRKWLNHQKIDKPSPSRFPQFGDNSRKLSNPREHSSEDQGPRTKEGNGVDWSGSLANNCASIISVDWKPDQITIERLKIAGLPEPSSSVLTAFVAHHRAKGTVREHRLWTEELVKWCANQRVYDASRRQPEKIYDKPLDIPEPWQ